MTDSGWSGKEKLIQEDVIWGVGIDEGENIRIQKDNRINQKNL